jgi:carotenoid cleavage dioxygenase
MRYGVVTREGRLQVSEITLPGPRRPHDIGVSRNYSILHDFPIFFDPEHFKRTGKRVPTFHPDVPTRFGVLPRMGGNADVRWFECEPCYMLHVINCWEEGDWLVQVGCRTNDPSVHGDPQDGELATMIAYMTLQANLYEWRFNLKTGEVRERPLDSLNAEFPSINRNFMGRPSRYAYLQYIPHEAPLRFEALVKYDITRGTHERYDYGPGIFGSEVSFAPRAGAQAEDDGYLVGFVTDTSDWSSACWVFDARDVKGGPIAKLKLPHRLPGGFHALWVEGSNLAGAARG